MFSRTPMWVWVLAMATAVLIAVRPAHAAPAVSVLAVDGVIGPASSDYLVRGIERSSRNGDRLLIIQIDTPGGLDTSMRSVIKAILTAPVPVAVYVAPSGARAASAGTYLLYASHIAAMAPGTNLGAATPLAIGMEPFGGERAPRPNGRAGSGQRAPDGQDADAPVPHDAGSAMHAKQINDAAAYIRGLAQLRGRNADWAEQAVRQAVSLTADEALKLNVIEFVATDVHALLGQLDGHTVNVAGRPQRLATQGAPVVRIEPDWRTKALAVVANPSIALLLMTIGVYGLLFEFMNPGFGVPGVIGAIALLLGLYALQLLPVNYAGLGLIVLGLMFMGAEAFIPSFGVLGLGGVVAFVAGSLILIDTELPGFGIPPALIGTLGVASALLIFGVVKVALKTRQRAVTSGVAGMIGAVVPVEAVAPGDGRQGWVRIQGELWHAVCEHPLRQAQQVRVLGREGLILAVVADNPTTGE